MPASARWAFMALLSLIVASYAATLLLMPAAFPPFLKDRANIVPIAVYAHLTGGMLAIALGPFQFSRRLRTHYLDVHRWMGRIYLTAILIGGIGGLVLAPMSQTNVVAHAGFALLAVAWMFTGARAYQFIRAGDTISHRRWMIRNFSLTFAAVTLRIYIPMSIALHISFEDAYPAIAWLCWVPNLMVAEWAIVRRVTSNR